MNPHTSLCGHIAFHWRALLTTRLFLAHHCSFFYGFVQKQRMLEEVQWSRDHHDELDQLRVRARKIDQWEMENSKLKRKLEDMEHVQKLVGVRYIITTCTHTLLGGSAGTDMCSMLACLYASPYERFCFVSSSCPCTHAITGAVITILVSVGFNNQGPLQEIVLSFTHSAWSWDYRQEVLLCCFWLPGLWPSEVLQRDLHSI